MYNDQFQFRGESTDSTDPFRGWFGHIGELRSIIPHASVLIMTATSSDSTRTKLKRKLCLNLVDCIDIIDSPDRANIKLHVSAYKSAAPLYDVFQWLIVYLREQHCQRMLIFCRTIDDCGKLYTTLKCSLTESCMSTVEMYHSNTLQHVKDRIQCDMNDSNGKVRVLICTSAAGMGVNFTCVYHVVHFGPPYTTDSLVQQMGRGGRDIPQCHHLMLYCNRQLKGVESEVKAYIASTECRRKVLMSFYSGHFAAVPAHYCCDVCANSCECATPECDSFRLHPLLEVEDAA